LFYLKVVVFLYVKTKNKRSTVEKKKTREVYVSLLCGPNWIDRHREQRCGGRRVQRRERKKDREREGCGDKEGVGHHNSSTTPPCNTVGEQPKSTLLRPDQERSIAATPHDLHTAL
jgi:hypothetical protein